MFGKLKSLLGWDGEDATPLEFEIDNPWKYRIGGRMRIKLKDLQALEFMVTKIVERNIPQEGRPMRLTDYHVGAVCHDPENEYACDGRVDLVVRLWPKPNPIPGDEYWAFILWLGAEAEWTPQSSKQVKGEEIVDAIFEDPTGFTLPEGVSFDDEEFDGVTWKTEDGIAQGFVGAVTALKDDDGDGTVQEDERQVWEEEFYYLLDSANEDHVCFVHVDRGTGWTTMNIGFGTRVPVFEQISAEATKA